MVNLMMDYVEKEKDLLYGLKKKVIFLTGASGMIGSCLVDLLMEANDRYQLEIGIVAFCRNMERAKERFARYLQSEYFTLLEGDVNQKIDAENPCDYVIHAASNTHPMQYSTDPIGTITANVIGTQNVLEYALQVGAKRTVFLSSVEVYGENRGDVDYFEESYCGYIDCNTLRAGYPESKRVGEALCQAYMEQKKMDVVIPRLSRVYGPTMKADDSKAIAQFIRKAVKGEDIVLKSEGKQKYSYTFVADAVIGILYCMLKGDVGVAYNIADDHSHITLRELAQILAEAAGTKVVFDLPDEKERKGYSTATKALLENSKIKELGWTSRYDMRMGLQKTLEILEDCL